METVGITAAGEAETGVNESSFSLESELLMLEVALGVLAAEDTIPLVLLLVPLLLLLLLLDLDDFKLLSRCEEDEDDEEDDEGSLS